LATQWKKINNNNNKKNKSGAASGVRRSNRFVESPLTKETRINTNKNKSPFNKRRLPTQRNHSSPAVTLKRSASVVVSFADTTSICLTMPPKKKTTAATTGAAASKEKKKPKTSNYTELEDQLRCQAYINVSTDSTIGNGTMMKLKQFWSKVSTMYKHLLKDNKDDLEEWVLDADRGIESLKNHFSKKVQKNTLLFMTFYRRAYENRVSGSNGEDVLQSALEDTGSSTTVLSSTNVVEVSWKEFQNLIKNQKLQRMKIQLLLTRT
jgi:hypothetical protein